MPARLILRLMPILSGKKRDTTIRANPKTKSTAAKKPINKKVSVLEFRSFSE